MGYYNKDIESMVMDRMAMGLLVLQYRDDNETDIFTAFMYGFIRLLSCR